MIRPLIRAGCLLGFAAAAAVPAHAAIPPSTHLVSCSAGACLVVSGQRSSSAAAVRINGHRVEVAGQRRWQARLSLDTLREWSPPQARTLVVATLDPATGQVSEDEADLPIGLLGHVPLDTVVVAMK